MLYLKGSNIIVRFIYLHFEGYFMRNYRDLEYYKDLKLIRRILSRRFDDFPKSHCFYTQNIVHAVLGLPKVAGYILLENGLYIPHGWNHDTNNNLYVDLTLDQFKKDLPRDAWNRIEPITIVEPGANELLPDQELTRSVNKFDGWYRHTKSIEMTKVIKRFLDTLHK